ncbi:acylneuraminate cytidylyltransferase family protein [Pigmentiphaga sp. H8]|uniref:acylneuraminate cytidylyltransferase family protein n=1 Tax=Pigmentiphaga sp. H8 TaxID=2488560 RepID=UPI000F5A4250|nr:acylneuraminate cytidylyltransferase family protein [Pigmentiphaga sp. H8]AZG07265.1 acylneuraminate cytidylyltransferase family protein [Pigmentiphaga sp. H8]
MTTRICTICARGGSKGVPGKNIRSICGKPLIAWTIEQARKSQLFDLIAVSSDSPLVLDVARQNGADYCVQRPVELASDTAGKLPAIRHCVEQSEGFLGKTADLIIDLDVTSPLRLTTDIIEAVQLLEKSRVTNVITGARARRSPYFNLVEKSPSGHVILSKRLPQSILRRQDAPACFDMNASIYVWKRDAFMMKPQVFYEDTTIYEMPEHRSIDIDSELDFEIVEMLMRKRLPKD